MGPTIPAMVEHPSGVYLDHAAATPIDPRVREAMLPFLTDVFASPDSLHEHARAPHEAIEGARAAVSELIDGDRGEVIFTAGDSEARNLAVTGVANANAHRGDHLVVSAVEHPATLAAARSVTRASGALTIVGVDGEGYIDPDALAAAVTDTTVLVSIVHGQAEIGTVQDVATLIAASRRGRPDVAVHVDAGATAGRVPIGVDAWDCDLLTLGGGSLLGPRWVGALWVRNGIRLHPLIGGGLQEGGKRGGAHDVPGIVGLGVAAHWARAELTDRATHMRALADRLIDRLTAIPDVTLNGPGSGRIPGHVQVSVAAVESETLVLTLGMAGLAASPGSACSAAGKASPVLEAIGREAPDTHSAVLFTLAPTTSAVEIDRAAAIVADVVARLRAMSPLA
jgi:cysteine desulfurase